MSRLPLIAFWVAGIVFCSRPVLAQEMQRIEFLKATSVAVGAGIETEKQFNDFAVYKHHLHRLAVNPVKAEPAAAQIVRTTPPTMQGCEHRLPDLEGLATVTRQRRQASIGLVAAAECRHNIPAGLLDALVVAESSYRIDARSPVGAVGLAQLMPRTAQDLGVENRLDPLQNIEGGARYLKLMLERFASVPVALAAYNAGPNAVTRAGGIPPYRETTRYVSRILQLWSPAKTEKEPRPASFVQMLSF